MGRVEGKVAFITGAARGQGRSHAVRLAQEGADIIAVDLCGEIATVPYPLATPDDLDQTVKEVEALGRRIVASHADVRDFDGLKRALDAGVAELGRLDIVSANAGIGTFPGKAEELTEQSWQDLMDINLGGTWRTAKAAIPHLKAAGRGSIVLTSSSAGLKAIENSAHYVASKHGVVGLMRALALELAPYGIRVNSVHPGSCDTHMIHNDLVYGLFAPDLEAPTREQVAPRFQTLHAMPVSWVEPIDVSEAVLWLASDEARYVTGVTLSIDAGAVLK